VNAGKLMEEEKTVRKEAKEKAAALHVLTKETIEGLTDEQALALLRLKWIAPLAAALREMPEAIISELERTIQMLAGKYAVTYLDLNTQITDSQKALSAIIEELTGNEFDMKGLSELKSLLEGE
jgi:type I restriction enzyme M protein